MPKTPVFNLIKVEPLPSKGETNTSDFAHTVDRICRALRPLLLASSVMQLPLLKYAKTGDGLYAFEPARFRLRTALKWIIYLAVAMYLSVRRAIVQALNNISSIEAFRLFERFGSIFILVVCLVLCYVNQPVILQVVHGIATNDGELHDNGFRIRRHTWISRAIIVQLVCSLGLSLIRIALFFVSGSVTVTFFIERMICTEFCRFSSYIIVFQFTDLLIILREKLIDINVNLTHIGSSRNMLEAETHTRGDDRLEATTKRLRHIESLRRSHLSLCVFIRQINTAYGLQILMLIAYTCVLDICCLYELFVGVQILDQVLSFTRVISFSAIPLICVTVCHYVNLECDYTIANVHNIRYRTDELEIIQEISGFSTQMFYQKVYLNAGRVFDLNLSTWYSFMGVVCSYVIVMVQFSPAVDEGDAN